MARDSDSGCSLCDGWMHWRQLELKIYFHSAILFAHVFFLYTLNIEHEIVNKCLEQWTEHDKQQNRFLSHMQFFQSVTCLSKNWPTYYRSLYSESKTLNCRILATKWSTGDVFPQVTLERLDPPLPNLQLQGDSQLVWRGEYDYGLHPTTSKTSPPIHNCCPKLP